jgi:hypothetical protein
MKASRSWAVALCALAEALAIPSRAEPISLPAGVPAANPPAPLPVAASPGASPASASAASTPATGVAVSERTPLPSYFTVELSASGALFADGSALGSLAELEPVAREAAEQGSFAGAVLFADARAGASAEAVAEALRRAGFVTLVEARRSPPPELSAWVRAERARRARQRLIATGVIEADPPARSSVEPNAASRSGVARDKGQPVELQTVGLYLAGAANTEPSRRQLVKLFERNFGAFKRCHAQAPEHVENASFGVDLLVPKEGGSAKVRQTRTRLTGKPFQTCMERAFQAIHFDPMPSGRPEIVSYSLLFRPAKR